MKWYGIIAIVFIFFALAGIVIIGSNPNDFYDFPQRIMNDKFTDYECAKYVDLTDELISRYGETMTVKEGREIQKMSIKFVVDGCMSRVDSWAHLTNNPQQIWDSDWQQAKKDSQDLLDAIEEQDIDIDIDKEFENYVNQFR